MGKNFEFGCWLMEVLLTNAPPFFRESYFVEIYNALVFFVTYAKSAQRPRGC